jgi:hypothetical protein
MRRFLFRGLTTLMILLLLFCGGFYVGQASRAKQDRRGYEVTELPGDMYNFFADLLESDAPATRFLERDEPAVEPEPAPEPEPAVVVAPTPDDMTAGQDMFDTGRFRDAAAAWKRILARKWSKTLEEDVGVANLFAVVVEQFPRGAFSDTQDTVIVRLRSGAMYEGRLIANSDGGVEVGLPDGSGIFLPADQIASKSICTRINRKDVFEDEYRRRLSEVASPRGYGYLDLVQWCRAHDLDGHLAYLLDKIREAEKEEGAVLGACLLEKFKGMSKYEQDEVAGLLTRFYPNAPGSREAHLTSIGVPPVDEPNRPNKGSAGASRREPSTPRTAPSDDFISRLEKAKSLASKGKHHYNKARPDMPNRADHRNKAKDALTKAKIIFEELLDERDEMWLQRHLKDVYQMLYWMRKDTPVK